MRAGFVATAAGIGFSFLVLAGALVVLQAGGAAIGGISLVFATYLGEFFPLDDRQERRGASPTPR